MSTDNSTIPAKFISLIASALHLTEKQIRSATQLFIEGATIPFISRYRKEMTDGMDEVQHG